MTLQDVASHAGVTTMTVSRYLRAPTQVASATADKIAIALLSTGYTPNLQAGSLASGRSQVVAVIVPNMAHSIFADTLHGLGQGLQALDLQMLVASSNYSMTHEEQQIRTVLGWAPAAVVVTGRHHSPAAIALLQDYAQRGTPVVELWDWHDAADCKFSQVGFDHFEAGALMASALLARGHARYAFMNSAVTQDFRAQERGRGFAQAIAQAGYCAQMLTAPHSEFMEAGSVCMRTWLSAQHGRLDCGMAFANDVLAVGAAQAAAQAEVKIPGELGLLGFGDFPISRVWQAHAGAACTQGLSTLSVQGEQIGRQCAQLLAKSLQTEASLRQPAQQHIAPQLQIRGS